jgi:hypothetical protein
MTFPYAIIAASVPRVFEFRVLVTGEGSKVFDGLSVGRHCRFTARAAEHKGPEGDQTH